MEEILCTKAFPYKKKTTNGGSLEIMSLASLKKIF